MPPSFEKSKTGLDSMFEVMFFPFFVFTFFLDGKK